MPGLSGALRTPLRAAERATQEARFAERAGRDRLAYLQRRIAAQAEQHARLTAQASAPVFNTVEKRDDVLKVATTATYYLRHRSGTQWSIDSWTVTTNTLGFAPLNVK